MRRLVIGLVATVGLMGLLGGQANAISCTTTQVVSLGQTMSESALGAGVCVLANDKLYGNFNFGNSPANGTVLFNWNLATGTHSIQLEAGYVSGTTYTGIHYEVAISGGPPGSYISMEAGDFDLSLGGASTLTKLITPDIPSGLTPVSFTCSRTFGGAQNCPQGVPFSAAQNLQDLTADITFVDNGTTGAIIDTTIESITVTPEPSTMVFTGTALLLLSYWGRKRLFRGRQHLPGTLWLDIREANASQRGTSHRWTVRVLLHACGMLTALEIQAGAAPDRARATQGPGGFRVMWWTPNL